MSLPGLRRDYMQTRVGIQDLTGQGGGGGLGPVLSCRAEVTERYTHAGGGSSFLLRGGVDQNNDDAEHRPRASKRRADFFWGVYLNPVSDVFLASINTMETIKSSA